MPIATKNLKLTIVPVDTVGIGSEITFTSVAADGDYLRIPYRYPFADIANLSALKTAGYFRASSDDVSTDILGGSNTTDTEGNLGFQLPQTEKLKLFVRRTGVASTGTAEEIFTIKGSTFYGTPDYTKTWAADATFVSGTKIIPVNVYNLGLYISGVSSEKGITIVVTDKTLEFALVAYC